METKVGYKNVKPNSVKFFFHSLNIPMNLNFNNIMLLNIILSFNNSGNIFIR